MTRAADTLDRLARQTADDLLLLAEIERLREDNADLRASALLWKRLYEQVVSSVEVVAVPLTSVQEPPAPTRVDRTLAQRGRKAAAALSPIR